MLHVRIITPADRTDQVVSTIEKTVGATHLAVLPGAARNPRGDIVMCDVAREAADELLHALRALGIVIAGTLTLLAQKWFWARQRARDYRRARATPELT